jgi:hypothetical protein
MPEPAENGRDPYSEEETICRSEAALLRALSMPRKKQSEMKLGRPRRSVGENPTMLRLRRTLDREAAAALKGGECSTNHLIDAVFRCLPNDIVHPVLLPADGTGNHGLALRFSADFERCVAFAAEYWASLVHKPVSLNQAPNASVV